MSTQTAEKIYKEIKELRGEYRDSFVRRILKKANFKPRFTFNSKKDFLKQISTYGYN